MTNEQGKYLVKDLGDGKWELEEQVYQSCLEAEADVVAEFEKYFGMSLEDALTLAAKNPNFRASEGFDSDAEVSMRQQTYIGYAEATMLKGRAKVLCGFFGSSTDLSVRFPVVLGYELDGQFHRTTTLWDNYEKSQRYDFLNTVRKDGEINSIQQLKAFLDSYPKGGFWAIRFFTFRGLTDEAVQNNPYPNAYVPYWQDIALLLSELDNGYAGRVGSVNASELAHNLTGNDPGIFTQTVEFDAPGLEAIR